MRKDRRDGEGWNTKNESGALPVEFKVLCKVDPMEKTTEGGIYIPDMVQRKEKLERVVVTLVAIGGSAFTDPPWGEPLPEIGNRVRVSKYAGDMFEGPDGYDYILLVDKNIEAIVIDEAEVKYSPTNLPDGRGDGDYAHMRSQ